MVGGAQLCGIVARVRERLDRNAQDAQQLGESLVRRLVGLRVGVDGVAHRLGGLLVECGEQVQGAFARRR